MRSVKLFSKLSRSPPIRLCSRLTASQRRCDVLRRAAKLKLPISTRYVSEGPAELSRAHASGWDNPTCRTPYVGAYGSPVKDNPSKSRHGVPCYTLKKAFHANRSSAVRRLLRFAGSRWRPFSRRGCECPKSQTIVCRYLEFRLARLPAFHGNPDSIQVIT